MFIIFQRLRNQIESPAAGIDNRRAHDANFGKASSRASVVRNRHTRDPVIKIDKTNVPQRRLIGVRVERVDRVMLGSYKHQVVRRGLAWDNNVGKIKRLTED